MKLQSFEYEGYVSAVFDQRADMWVMAAIDPSHVPVDKSGKTIVEAIEGIHTNELLGKRKLKVTIEVLD